ncbi:MAG: recombinase RecT, partial [Cyanobacteriota bacterium]
MSDPSPPSTALARPAPAMPQHSSPPVDISSGVFSGIAAFEAAQRMAQALCTSTMVPSEYRGQQGLSNSLIALEIAARMGLSPLVVMQNMTPIHGKPTWSSSFLIATVNASGRFTPLRFVFDDKEQPSRCYAVASDKASGEVLEGETISVEMAKRKGWWSRPDRYGKETSKWQSMTGQMLRYRAAAFWVKVYCPEISLGLMTQDEAADVQPVVVDAIEPQGGGQSRAQPAAAVPELLPPRPLQPAAGPPAPAALSATDSDEKTQATTAEAPDPAPPAARRSSRRTAAAQKGADGAGVTDIDGTTAAAPELDAPAAAPTQEPAATAQQLTANELPAIKAATPQAVAAAPQAVAATQAE